MRYTLRRVGKFFHVYFLDRAGRRVRKSTKQSDKRRAIVVADDLYRRFADPTYQAAHATTLDDGARRLKESLIHAGKSAGTLHFYEVKLSHVGRVLGADSPLASITARRVDEYISTRKSEHAKAYTISKELTALRMLLKHARRRGEFDRELSQVMPVQFATGYKPRERRISEETAWALIEKLPNGPARYVAFVCATTARDAAARRARGSHLSEAGIQVLGTKTKLDARTVPLTTVTDPFAKFAFRDLDSEQFVAPGVSSVRHALHRACDALKIPRISPNDLRRSVAHWLRARRVPLDLIAGIFGHADTRMLERIYGKLDSAELGRALAQSLEGSGKNDPKTSDPSEAPDKREAEKPCPETESNRRHGDFQSAPEKADPAGKRSVSFDGLDDSWIEMYLAHRAQEVAANDAVAIGLAKCVRSARAGDREGTHAEMRSVLGHLGRRWGR